MLPIGSLPQTEDPTDESDHNDNRPDGCKEGPTGTPLSGLIIRRDVCIQQGLDEQDECGDSPHEQQDK